MPRPAVTPAARVTKTKADLDLSPNAIKAALTAIDNGDSAALLEACKFLEAVGCYGRRTAAVLDQAPKPTASYPRSTVQAQKVSIFGPNLADQSKGQFVVHAKGCADCAKVRDVMGGRAEAYTITASSLTEIATEMYADHIEEGSMTDAEAVSDFHFAPCVKLAE